jgi:hypothetical protein
MDLKNEIALFDQLSGNNRLKDWLNDKLEIEYSVLSANSDIDQLRRSQGRALLLKSMIELLAKAPVAVRQHPPG